MNLRPTFLTLLLAVVSVRPAAAEDDPNTFLDPAAAGVDYALQGEYAGEITTDDGAHKLGVQVIALGEGKFHAIAFHGGLPGEGYTGRFKLDTMLGIYPSYAPAAADWAYGGETKQVDGAMVDGKAVFENDGGRGEIADGVLTIWNSGGKELGRLQRVERTSPTLGAKPPEGAVVLFDGSSADGFEGGRLSSDGLLMPGATSKHKYQNATIHIEFRTPFQPLAREQGRGNSGVYVQGRYEVQMLDSFGLEGRHNECGGIYSTRDPLLNMCLPPLVWQTYDIDFTAATFDDAGAKTANARMTVRHNGVEIHTNVECDHATTASPLGEGAEPGPLYVQDHGNPVRYRNIWIVEK
jgi:hypothetical protein